MNKSHSLVLDSRIFRGSALLSIRTYERGTSVRKESGEAEFPTNSRLERHIYQLLNSLDSIFPLAKYCYFST